MRLPGGCNFFEDLRQVTAVSSQPFLRSNWMAGSINIETALVPRIIRLLAFRQLSPHIICFLCR